MKDHGITDRVTELSDHARERLMHSRAEKQDRENERLRYEVSILRDDLDAERGMLKDALNGLESRKGDARRSRKPHLVRTLVIAGGAYVLGTRDGRERYDQIVRKARSFIDAVKSRMLARNAGGSESPEEASIATL